MMRSGAIDAKKTLKSLDDWTLIECVDTGRSTRNAALR